MYINLLCYFLLSVYSAGVGRTGVLIAVEVAMNMIEASEPIDLMDITRKMRDQRGMMIQSPVGGRGGGGAGGGLVVEYNWLLDATFISLHTLIRSWVD